MWNEFSADKYRNLLSGRNWIIQERLRKTKRRKEERKGRAWGEEKERGKEGGGKKGEKEIGIPKLGVKRKTS